VFPTIARGDLDDALVVDVAAALCCEVRNDPGKSNLWILYSFFSWTFPADENVASLPPSPQPRIVSDRQENRPASSPRHGTTTFIFDRTETPLLTTSTD
jgi:hypothetical protein